MPLSGQRHRPLVHMRRRPPPRVLVGELHELTHQTLPLASVSSRKPRAVCCARQPRNIASPIASSGRKRITPDTNSRCAAPAKPTCRNQPSRHARIAGRSCIRRDRYHTSAQCSAVASERRNTDGTCRRVGDDAWRAGLAEAAAKHRTGGGTRAARDGTPYGYGARSRSYSDRKCSEIAQPWPEVAPQLRAGTPAALARCLSRRVAA